MTVKVIVFRFVVFAILVLFVKHLEAYPISQNHKRIFDSVIQNYSRHDCFEYEAVYKNKYFDDSLFTSLQYHVNLIRADEDTIFGFRFYYKYLLEGRTSYKYYNGKNLFVIDSGAEKYYSFDPYKNQRSPINGAIDGMVIRLSALFKPEKLTKMLYSEEDNIQRYDTLIDNIPYVVYKTIFEDTEEYKESYRLIYINCKDYAIQRIFAHVSYQGQTQINDMCYQNFRTKKISSSYLNQLFELSKSRGSQEVIYKPKKMDSLSIGSLVMPINGKTFPDDKEIVLPDSGKITIYDFWYSSCLPCIKLIPVLNKIHEKYKDAISVYAINSDQADIAKPNRIIDFNKRTPILYPIILIPHENIQPLKVEVFPTIYLLDTKGKLVFKHYGFNEDEDLFKMIDEQLSDMVK